MHVTLAEVVGAQGMAVAIGRGVEAAAWAEGGDLAIRFDAIDGTEAVVYLRGGVARTNGDLGHRDVMTWCPHAMDLAAAA